MHFPQDRTFLFIGCLTRVLMEIPKGPFCGLRRPMYMALPAGIQHHRSLSALGGFAIPFLLLSLLLPRSLMIPNEYIPRVRSPNIILVLIVNI